MSPLPAAILFDLDGTLVDSLDDIAGALNAVLVELGRAPHPRDAVRQWVGEGGRHLVRGALGDDGDDEALVDDVLARYRARYRADVAVHTRPFDGIVPMLEALSARGVPMAVVTNKPTEIAVEVVRRVLPAVFGIVVGEEEGQPRKPDPTPALRALRALGIEASPQVAFVGDSGIDLETASRAGLRGIGVTWGIRDPAEGAAPGAVLERATDVAALSRALGLGP